MKMWKVTPPYIQMLQEILLVKPLYLELATLS